MKSSTKFTLVMLALSLAVPAAARAESSTVSGGANLSTTAHVDFSIIIPRVLFLRIGALGAGIDAIVFTVPAANVGNGTPVAGTGGDLTLGQVTAVVQANGNANVQLKADATGALTNASGDTINYSQINTASNNGSLPAPVLNNATSGTITVNAVGKIVNQSAVWTYSYLNSAVVPAGTYGSTVALNGRITYTATLP